MQYKQARPVDTDMTPNNSTSNDDKTSYTNMAEQPYTASTVPLSVQIELAIRQYFKELGEETPCNLYEVMLHQLEKPLLMVVLEQTRGNQTRTAEILGLNRGTLRKKLKTHHMM